MTPLARRGRNIYGVLAAVLIAWQLFDAGFRLSKEIESGAGVDWWRSVLRPLLFVAMVIGLRSGDRLCRWGVALWMCSSGFVPVFAAVMMSVRLLRDTPIKHVGLFFELLGPALGILAVLGLAQILLGCAVLWLPSLRAYFEERRAAAAT